MSHAPRKLSAWLAAGALASAPAFAQSTDAAQVEALERACADVPVSAATADLDALSERMNEAQAASTGTGHHEACTGWRQVVRDPASSPLLRADWAAKVAASLVWMGRSADAAPLLDAAYQQYAQAGPGQSDNAGMVAGMLTIIWVQRGQLDTALTWSQRAVDAVRSPGSTTSVRDRLRLVLNHCSLLSRARRYEEAQPLLQQAYQEALAQASPLYAEAASALNTQATLARRQSRLAESLEATEGEIALRRTHLAHDPVQIANALQNRGVILIQMARFDDAESALNEALAHARAAQAAGPVDLFGHQASVRETLSGLLLARGRPADALKAAQEAVAVLAGRPEASTARGARPLRRVAEAQLALGELSQGVATYRQAIALLSTSVGAPDADDAMAIRLGYTLAMIELGEIDEAQATLKLVASDKRPRTAEETARVQVLQASIAQRRGDTAGATQAWLAADQALAASLPEQHPDRRFIRAQACDLGALPCPPPEGAQSKPETDALVHMALARHTRAAGDALSADASARAAVAAAMASGQPRLQWQALALWADLLADAGQRQQAIFVGKLALSQLQQQRQRLLPLGSVADAHYLADKTPLYRRVADWLLQAQRIPEALEVMRLLKLQEQADFNERGLAETAATSTLAFNAAEQAAWRRFERVLQGGDEPAEELRSLSERAAALRITPEENARLQLLRRQVEAKLDARTARLQSVLHGLEPSAAPAHARARGRMQRPGAGELHVYTLAGERQLSLLMVGASDTRLHRLDLSSAELARQVGGLREALDTSAAQAPALAQAMYGQIGRLIDAAAQRNRAGQIVVWLDGPLRYLPPGIMQDGGQPLAARYRWVVSGAFKGAPPAAGRATAAPQMAAFGVTRAFQGLPALPAVAEEVCSIVNGPVMGLGDTTAAASCSAEGRGRGLVPGRALLNEHFTEAALTTALAQAHGAGHPTQAADELLHISTHFVLRPGSVGKSWLLLGDGSRLSLERMRALDFAASRLVTLSACETAVSDTDGSNGREIDGLASTLLDRGARQVLASLWRVDDRATARFMQRFYAAYATHRGRASHALQAAQQQAIHEGAPARDWAAFILLAR